MARILLGWELGAGSGHAVKLARLAAALREGGHEPIAVVQATGAMPADIETWQAPLWPGQIAALARPAAVPPATMGDILATLGLADAGAMRALIAAWDRLLAAIRPDAIAAEFAPALMLAARGRVPLVALGTGFSLPPPETACFASLTGQPAARDEAVLLAGLNHALVATGRARIEALPRIFAADRRIPAVFAELDPYRDMRGARHGAPSLAAPVPAGDGKGEELFVYLGGTRARPEALWRGLAASGLKVRIYDATLSADQRAALEQAGLTVEHRRVPIARIVDRSRLLLSIGGLGFVSSALLAGLPQIVLPYDIEKGLTAAALGQAGLGRSLLFDTLDADRFAAELCAAFDDAALHERARAAAPGFAARMAPGCEAESVAAIEDLLREAR